MSLSENQPTADTQLCGCYTCVFGRENPNNSSTWVTNRTIACPTCGNERCPRSHYHENACFGSPSPSPNAIIPSITYRQLKEAIERLPPEHLDDNVSVYLIAQDEYYPGTAIRTTGPEQDVLDADHLVIDIDA